MRRRSVSGLIADDHMPIGSIASGLRRGDFHELARLYRRMPRKGAQLLFVRGALRDREKDGGDCGNQREAEGQLSSAREHANLLLHEGDRASATPANPSM
jgi:hypothetical protein